MKPAAAKRRAMKPAMINVEYSIPPSSLHYYCTKLMPAGDRLPSFMLPGRGKKPATRLVYEDELKSWLEKYRVKHAA